MMSELGGQGGVKWCKSEGVICSEGVKWCKSWAANGVKWCKSERVYSSGGGG